MHTQRGQCRAPGVPLGVLGGKAGGSWTQNPVFFMFFPQSVPHDISHCRGLATAAWGHWGSHQEPHPWCQSCQSPEGVLGTPGQCHCPCQALHAASHLWDSARGTSAPTEPPRLPLSAQPHSICWSPLEPFSVGWPGCQRQEVSHLVTQPCRAWP